MLPQVIALDGKTLRGSRDAFHGTPALYLVPAWASTSRLILAQVAVRENLHLHPATLCMSFSSDHP